jgi:hypothetical protein
VDVEVAHGGGPVRPAAGGGQIGVIPQSY